MDIKDWLIPYGEITIDFTKVLGKGEFNVVYEGVWRGLQVAVKYFNPKCNPELKVHLQREMMILTKTHHPHVIQVLGVCFDPFLILLEHMSGGNLYEQMVKIRHYPNFWIYEKKRSWCKQITLGLNYLHERKPEQIIHRDLKPSNILIGPNQTLKISDFGTSKILRQSFQDLSSLNYTQNVGTFNYMAPEMMMNRLSYDCSVDIYSLGLIFYEIWENKRWFHDLFIENIDDLKKETFRGLRLRFFNTPKTYRQMIMSCISLNPDQRPTAREVLKVL